MKREARIHKIGASYYILVPKDIRRDASKIDFKVQHGEVVEMRLSKGKLVIAAVM